MADYSNVSFRNDGKLKLLIIVGTRPEIIRLAAVINKTRRYFDVILAHTGQNYDYNLNGVFFHDLHLEDPEVYLNAVGADLGETMGNIISESYKLMVATQPDAVLVLGDTNSCLSVIGAKRLHIPIFHMEAGNRRKDECLPEESSFFTSVGHPFPAVCIRTSTERPESLDKAGFILSGIDEKGLLQAVDVAVEMVKDGCFGLPVPNYVDENVSDKVVKLIQSYVGVVNKMVWRKG